MTIRSLPLQSVSITVSSFQLLKSYRSFSASTHKKSSTIRTTGSTTASAYYNSILQRVKHYGFPTLSIQNIHRLLGYDSGSDRNNNNAINSNNNSNNTSSTSLSIVDVCRYCHTLAMAGDTIWKLHAYESIVDSDTVITLATAVEERRRQRQPQQRWQRDHHPTSPHQYWLEGIPISIKSNLAIATLPFTAGSRILGGGGTTTTAAAAAAAGASNSTAGTDHTLQTITTNMVGYNADVVTQLLHNSHAILIGTTTMDEFGMGSFGTNTITPTTTMTMTMLPKNPIPFLYQHHNHHHQHHLDVEPWNDLNVVEFIQLPSEAIYNIHYDLLPVQLQPPPQDQPPQEPDLRSDENSEHVATEFCCNQPSLNHQEDTKIQQQQQQQQQEHEHYYRYDYAPGGSSCGSAISVRHGSAIVSLGSDTGGSIRLPAAYNNCIGYKPSYGILSRYGLIPYANSLDTIGIIANTTHCVATTYQQLIRNSTNNVSSTNDDIHDDDASAIVRDSTQSQVSSEYRESIRNVTNRMSSSSSSPSSSSSLINDFTHHYHDDRENTNDKRQQEVLQTLNGMKIGIPEAFSIQECNENVRTVWEDCATWLEQNGATIDVVTQQQISPTLIQQSLASYYILACAEASSNLSRYDGFRYGTNVPMNLEDFILTDDVQNDKNCHGTSLSILEQQYANTRTRLFGNEVLRRILCGTYVLSAEQYHTFYEPAAKIRAQITKQFTDVFEVHDFLLLPTTLYPPPTIGSDSTTSTRIDPTEMLANDIMTVPISLTGCPAISVSINGSTWNNNMSNKHQLPEPPKPPFQISMQLVGPRFSESTLLLVAAILEQYAATSPKPIERSPI
jgi:aspartyl-tRNA(Asn)/glutamyl-tRNA(Gln) amidotransferase subunit A